MIWWPVLAFALAMGLDLATTRVALLRGLTEANPLIASGDTILKMIVVSALVFFPAEACRLVGYPTWSNSLYLGGAVVHALAGFWNLFQLFRK